MELSLNLMTAPLYSKSWDTFSTAVYPRSDDPKAEEKTTKAMGSLEGIHNNYHGLLGGDFGHMGRPPIAAFDPVFWMHHT